MLHGIRNNQRNSQRQASSNIAGVSNSIPRAAAPVLPAEEMMRIGHQLKKTCYLFFLYIYMFAILKIQIIKVITSFEN